MEHENPYDSSQLDADAHRSAQRSPRSITVFGVLNLLFGMLGIFGGMMFFIMLGADGAGEIPNPAFEAMKSSPVFKAWTWFSTIGGLVAAVVLVISGIALLMKRDVGRRLAIYYAYYALIVAVIGVVLGAIYVYGPLFAKMGDAPAAAITVLVSAVLGTALSLLYPALILYFMHKPAVIRALQGGVNPFHA